MRDARARKETLKAKLPHLQTCLVYSEPALLPSLGPSNKQAGITLECGGYTSFPLEGEDPALPVWQAGLGEELLKRGRFALAKSRGPQSLLGVSGSHLWPLLFTSVSAPHLSAEASGEPSTGAA